MSAHDRCGYVPYAWCGISYGFEPCTLPSGHDGEHNYRCIIPAFTVSREPIEFLRSGKW